MTHCIYFIGALALAEGSFWSLKLYIYRILNHYTATISISELGIKSL
jgi:hypothetical protein